MPEPSASSAVGRTLVIKSGAGIDDAERCMQALTVGAAAIATGATVSMWLMGDAVHLAVPGVAEGLALPGATPAADLVALLLELGTLTVCSQCAARRDLSQQDLLDRVRIAGASSYVEEVLADGVQALIY